MWLSSLLVGSLLANLNPLTLWTTLSSFFLGSSFFLWNTVLSLLLSSSFLGLIQLFALKVKSEPNSSLLLWSTFFAYVTSPVSCYALGSILLLTSLFNCSLFINLYDPTATILFSECSFVSSSLLCITGLYWIDASIFLDCTKLSSLEIASKLKSMWLSLLAVASCWYILCLLISSNFVC